MLYEVYAALFSYRSPSEETESLTCVPVLCAKTSAVALSKSSFVLDLKKLNPERSYGPKFASTYVEGGLLTVVAADATTADAPMSKAGKVATKRSLSFFTRLPFCFLLGPCCV